MVCCRPEDDAPLYREHPIAVFEVLSASTSHIDRREKRAMYSMIPALKNYVLIEQNAFSVSAYRRHSGWEAITLDGPDQVLELEGIEVALPLAEIYERVTLSSGRAPVRD